MMLRDMMYEGMGLRGHDYDGGCTLLEQIILLLINY